MPFPSRAYRLCCPLSHGAQNAAILAVEMLALADEELAQRLYDFKCGLRAKIEKANQDLAEIKYQFKTN